MRKEAKTNGGSVHRPLGIIRLLLATALAVPLISLSFAEGPAAQDLTSRQYALVDGGLVPPTRAWVAFCDQNPGECAVDESDAAVVPFTQDLWNAIVRVNLRINNEITPVTDILHWGISDRWDYPTDGKGDCEDIQLAKRRALEAEGIPARAMRIAMVINKEGEGHAVLLVRTDRGDYVLDNRVNTVMAWYRTGYIWVKREGDGGRQWVSLGGIRAPVETAARE
jgi:predicted transglutaminase-like cysteine proteinase